MTDKNLLVQKEFIQKSSKELNGFSFNQQILKSEVISMKNFVTIFQHYIKL